MAIEAHIQGIARFLVGFGTEEDEYWRDYHFDFAGQIDYDPHTGVPQSVRPIEKVAVVLGFAEWERLSRVPSFGRLLMSAPLKPGDLPASGQAPMRNVK